MSNAKKLIEYFKSLDITVNTKTKARGHQGFYIKNRIDISKNVKEDKLVQTLLHEFAHYIHSIIESGIEKTGGSTEALFGNDNTLIIFEELLKVTNFVDENSLHKKLLLHKEKVKSKIKELDLIIKKDYPKFQRSKKFKEFDKVIRKSKAKYLLKYDRVRICGCFFQKDKIYTIENIENDFPELKPAFCAYIKLKSYQKKQQRITARINKLDKYYKKPTELFARFIEGIYLDEEFIKTIAPKAYETFFSQNNIPYQKLKAALNLAKTV